jgi:hypothetical protein
MILAQVINIFFKNSTKQKIIFNLCRNRSCTRVTKLGWEKIFLQTHILSDFHCWRSAPTLKYVTLYWMEILDVVHQSNPVNPLEECWDPGKVYSFSELWRSLRTV